MQITWIAFKGVMSSSVAPLKRAETAAGTCLLCKIRPVGTKRIYNYPVCKKCYYRFANRRQLGYLLDAIFSWLCVVTMLFVLDFVILSLAADRTTMRIINLAFAALWGFVFAMKDGFDGFSPGKWMCDIQVRDVTSGYPISFAQSFRRNAVLLWSAIPVIGPVIKLVYLIIIATQVGQGYRKGDKMGNTKAVWKRFAHTPVFSRNNALCDACGYDLRGNVSGICPECGQPIPQHKQAIISSATQPTSVPRR